MKKMKRVLAFLLAVVWAFLCAACQPAREEEAAAQMDPAFVKEKISAVPVPDEPGVEAGEASYKKLVDGYKATLPAHWSGYIETEYIQMPIEADILVENTDGFPVYQIKQGAFDMALGASIANHLMPGATGIREGLRPLPEEYDAAIRSLNQRGMTEYAQFMLEDSKEAESGSYEKIDRIAFTEEENQSYVVRYGDGNLGQVLIRSNTKQFYKMEICTNFYSAVHMGEMVEMAGSYVGEESVKVEPSVTKEEAGEMLEAFLLENGLENYRVDKVSSARHFDNLTREEISQGWRFELVPAYGYYPLDAVQAATQGGWLRLYVVESYCATWNQESLYVYISEKGVEDVQWNYPYAIEGCVNPCVELMDFEEIQKKFVNLITEGLSYFEQPSAHEPTVTKVVLTLVPQQMKDDPDTAYLMPVWVCVIDWKPKGPEQHCEQVIGLNAIDGSRVALG